MWAWQVQDMEDPHRLGLVLEWVYGTIVSTAEKARDGAKRSLGGSDPAVTLQHPCLQPGQLKAVRCGIAGHASGSQVAQGCEAPGFTSCWKLGLTPSVCGAGIRPPTAQGAYDLLMQALQDQADWERRARAAKELLNDMVRSRRDAAQLAQQYDIKYVPAAPACLEAAHTTRHNTGWSPLQT